MSKFEITDEAIATLWDGLVRECHEAAFTDSISQHFLQLSRRSFLRMLANFPQNILAGVTDVADGTGEPVLRIVVCDRYKRHFMRSAKRFHKVRCH